MEERGLENRKRGLENRKGCMLNPFRVSIFAKKSFCTSRYLKLLVFQCKKHLFKKLIFDGIEIHETYFSRN